MWRRIEWSTYNDQLEGRVVGATEGKRLVDLDQDADVALGLSEDLRADLQATAESRVRRLIDFEPTLDSSRLSAFASGIYNTFSR